MFDSILLRILLSPFALLFGLGVTIKNILYAIGLLRGVKYSLPVIGVGNLTVGGAGKTPHTEYMIRLLQPYLQVATLSRGYARKSKGFILANVQHTHNQIGDEPMQYRRKYPDIIVAVSESRAEGIPKLLQKRPETQVIILDDAFQHRTVEPGLQILLTEYHLPYTRDFLLPSGRLREWRSAAQRADIIIVSKCPPEMSLEEKEAFKEELHPRLHQKLFFTRYRYFTPYALNDPEIHIQMDRLVSVLMVCAIARTQYLLDYLHKNADAVNLLEFEDHHTFTRYDLEQIQKYFIHLEADAKIVLTTEKDAMRLAPFRQFFVENEIPIFVLPIEVEFLFGEGEVFDVAVKEFLLEFRV